MLPFKHPNATQYVGPPPKWNANNPDNQMVGLDVRPHRINSGPVQIQSWWKPSEDELTVLNRGGLVVHDIMADTVRPVSLYAEDHPDYLNPKAVQDVEDKNEGLHGRVLAFCEAVRQSREDNAVAYTQGSCYQFHLILKTVWPKAVAMYDGMHVVTEINGRLYDIKGEWKATARMPPYRLDTEPGVLEQLKKCYYSMDTARFLKDTTPIPLLPEKAAQAMEDVLKTLNGGEKFNTNDIANMLVIRLRAAGVHLCKDSK